MVNVVAEEEEIGVVTGGLLVQKVPWGLWEQLTLNVVRE